MCVPDQDYYMNHPADNKPFCGDKLIAFPRVLSLDGEGVDEMHLEYNVVSYLAYHWDMCTGPKRTELMKLDAQWEKRRVPFGTDGSSWIEYTAPFLVPGGVQQTAGDEDVGLS